MDKTILLFCRQASRADPIALSSSFFSLFSKQQLCLGLEDRILVSSSRVMQEKSSVSVPTHGTCCYHSQSFFKRLKGYTHYEQEGSSWPEWLLSFAPWPVNNFQVTFTLTFCWLLTVLSNLPYQSLPVLILTSSLPLFLYLMCRSLLDYATAHRFDNGNFPLRQRLTTTNSPVI